MQTQYQNVAELAWAVENARKENRDFIAPTSKLRMLPAPSQVPGEMELDVGGDEEFLVNDYAHGQIAERIGIPKKYYDRMRQQAPQLLADNVNHWFRHEDEKRLVRTTQGNVVRAFLSDKYQRIDNYHVLAAIYPVLADLEARGLTYQSLALTGERMYLKAVLPTVRGEVGVGDICEAGVEFRNGEIGNSRFEAWPFAFRLICKNGARFETGGFKKLHVGARADVGEDVYEMLSDETLKLDDAAYLAKVKDMVAFTLAQPTFDKLLDKMRAAATDKLEAKAAPSAVERLGEVLELSQDEQSAVLTHLIEGGDLSRWGLANAVTRAAQDLPSYDRSDALEGFGGRLIELPRSQWAELAQAA